VGEEQKRQELHSHEFSDLWERWLTRDQRREVGRALWTSRPLGDGRLEALVVIRARRQWKWWAWQIVVSLLLVAGALLRVGRADGAGAPLDWVVLVGGAVILAVSVAGVATHRRTLSRLGNDADWGAVRELARSRRDT
jgi:hypothetical protein